MRGWVPFDFRSQRRNQTAHKQDIAKKRLKGFEPTTFCMAIRPGSGFTWQRYLSFAGIS
jgi:hypothetical protein